MRSVTKRGEAALWLSSAILALVAARGWAAGIDAGAEGMAEIPAAAAAAVAALDGDSLAAAADYAAEHDPFRLARRPSDVPYVPGVEGAAPEVPPLPKPVLSLRGIVGGDPWQGVVDGLPGVGGSTVVRQGQVIGDLRISLVTRDLVVVEGMDTTWSLRIERAW